MDNVEVKENSSSESSTTSVSSSQQKDQKSTVVPKNHDINGTVIPGHQVSMNNDSEFAHRRVPPNTMTPKSSQVVPTIKTDSETAEKHCGSEDTYPALKVRVDSSDSLEKIVSELLSDNANPEPKIGHDTFDAPPQEQNVSVPSSNIANLTDPPKEESVASHSDSSQLFTKSNSSSVEQQSQEVNPVSSKQVQQKRISDEPTPEHETSLASTRKPDVSEFSKDEVLESASSPTTEAKPNGGLSSSKADHSGGGGKGLADHSTTRSSSFPRVPQVVVHHHRKASDGAAQALAASGVVSKVNIDTAAPIESVKDAVSKFGGIVDWKAHKVQTVERRRFIDEELQKVQEEIPVFKEQSKAAEDSKVKMLRKLDSSKRLIEELKLNLERAQKEEYQAKQDSELAKLRVEEMEQGIADEASVAAKVQFEVAKARHLAVISELQSLKGELEALCKDYDSLVAERDTAMKKAEEAVSASKEVEKTVEDLTFELMTTKESLESAHAAHLEAEEHRAGVAMAQEQEILNCERELKQAEEEVEKLHQQILSKKDLKSKLDTASGLLHDLKTELAAYMESKSNKDTDKNPKGEFEGQEKKTHGNIKAAVDLARKNLEEVKISIEKATNEVNLLKAAAASFKSELESEKTAMDTIRKREGMASVAVETVQAELNRTKTEISLVKEKETEAREKMDELSKQLDKVGKEVYEAKSLANAVNEEVKKAKEEAEQAKAGASTMESRLLAAQKEIEAAKASEKLALAAINALQESEAAKTPKDDETPSGVILSLEEYYELNKQVHEAEGQANERVANALSQIEVAKESEVKNKSKLEDATSELARKKEALELAKKKAENAKQGKLNSEQELRTWRAEHEQQRRDGESGPGAAIQNKSPRASFEGIKGDAEPKNLGQEQNATAITNDHKPSPKASTTEAESSPDVKTTKKKKKSIFPRFFMFLGRKKSHSKPH